MYETDLAQIDKEAAEQDKMLADVTRANRDFEAQKKTAGDRGNREREAALQALDNAYYKYKEIVSNVEVGRKFYNDLSKIVGSFRDRCRDWVSERRKDARTLEDEIAMPPLSSLSLGQQQAPPQAVYQSPTSPPQAFYHNAGPAPVAPMSPPAEARIQSWAREDNAQPPEQPQPRPMPPLQMWQPDMGIKFAPSPAAGGSVQAPGQGGNGPVGGKWDPKSGIRFG